jgi:3-phenylpropionate/cinnamic acid dioxygenase small subunit
MDLAQRIAQLEAAQRKLTDKDELWRLITRYARAVDEEIDAEQSAIFSQDAIMETRPWFTGKPHQGREAVVKSFGHYIATFGNRRRFITNEQVDLTGADTATGWANWLVLHAHDGESYCGWGVYEWDFVRAADGWKISKMVIIVECMTTLEEGWGDAENMVSDYPGGKRK